MLLTLLLSTLLATASPHDIPTLDQWGPYSKEYCGISHIDDLESGIKVEFMLVPGQYRRSFKVPCTLFETDVHPWKVSADMRHICYRHEIEWKDRLYVDATYHVIDSGRVLLESHCVNNTNLVQNINLQVAARKSGGTEQKWNPEVTIEDDSFIVKYPEVDNYYGVVWDYPYSEVRQFRCAKLEQLMPQNAHDHVSKEFSGDKLGHYTANFLRPVTVNPQSDTTIYQLIVCGDKDYVAKELRAFKADQTSYTQSFPEDKRGYLPQAGEYAFGEQLIEATLMTNIVYPIDAYGRPIRHFCPGKHWDSLYTWDCGFIGWAMSYLDPERGYQIIRQYTTSPEEEAPFVHHGTPLATQIFGIADVWVRGGCDRSTLEDIYPRLKRFYTYMTGPACAKKSGLLTTWSLFYNSGGWDDYCAQWTIRPDKELRARTAPMVSSSYYIRCAKILRLMARELGLKQDVKNYSADIKKMGDAVLNYAWDPECGYFSYVIHDTEGNPQGFYRTDAGVNFNMGLDGVTPLVAGITDKEKTDRLLEHIFTKGELWSDCGITAIDQKAPYFKKDGYWNGTVWIPHQMILWKTMLDLGLTDKARQIAFTALKKWNEECSDSYNCYEHFIIESGRGGGWHNFSGLSSPLVNWYYAYFKPGTFTPGFNLFASEVKWADDFTSLRATVSSDQDAVGKTGAVLICMKPGHKYSVKLDGKEIDFDSPYDGLLEVKLNYSKKSVIITVDNKD